MEEIPLFLLLEPHDLGHQLTAQIVRQAQTFFQILDAMIEQR